ncbi:hypothetical protein GCM10009634_85030 [Saccharothrix xinjiangensis]
MKCTRRHPTGRPGGDHGFGLRQKEFRPAADRPPADHRPAWRRSATSGIPGCDRMESFAAPNAPGQPSTGFREAISENRTPPPGRPREFRVAEAP